MIQQLLKKRKPRLEHIETVIGANTSFEGHLKCDGNVRIDGVCHAGLIEAVGNVVITLNGRVMATIIADNVSVAGEVQGGIVTRGRLEILSTGRVLGDVQVNNFYKDEGGILSGNMVMQGQSDALKLLETKKQSTDMPPSAAEESDYVPGFD